MVRRVNASSSASCSFPREYESADEILKLEMREVELEMSDDRRSSFSLDQSLGELGFWSRVSVYREVKTADKWAREIYSQFSCDEKKINKVLSMGGPTMAIVLELKFYQSPDLYHVLLWFYSLKKRHRRGWIAFSDGSGIVMDRDQNHIYYSSSLDEIFSSH